MGFPIMTCVKCGEEFELRPNKPGYANRCYECSEPNEEEAGSDLASDNREVNAARREAMRNLLYRKDS